MKDDVHVVELGQWTSPSGQRVTVALHVIARIAVDAEGGVLPVADRGWFRDDVLPEALRRAAPHVPTMAMIPGVWNDEGPDS